MEEASHRSASAVFLAVAIAAALPGPAAAQSTDADAVRTANNAYYSPVASIGDTWRLEE